MTHDWRIPFHISPETIAPMTMYESLEAFGKRLSLIEETCSGWLQTLTKVCDGWREDHAAMLRETIQTTDAWRGVLDRLDARVKWLEARYSDELTRGLSRIHDLEDEHQKLASRVDDAAESARCAVDTHDSVHKRLSALEHDDRLGALRPLKIWDEPTCELVRAARKAHARLHDEYIDAGYLAEALKHFENVE